MVTFKNLKFLKKKLSFKWLLLLYQETRFFIQLFFSCSVMSDSMNLWTAACQTSLSFTISWSLLRLMSIETMMPSNHLILCHSLLLMPSIFPRIRVFSNELALYIRWPKYWSFSSSIHTSVNIQGWFPLGLTGLITLPSKGLSRVFSSTTVWRHLFFGTQPFYVQLSHLYMTVGKAIALTIWTFVGKVMSLLFDMLSRLVTAFLPRSKHLLISWLQSPPTVILEPPKIKSLTASTVSPFICH